MRGTLVIAGLCWLVAGSTSCGAGEDEEVDTSSAQSPAEHSVSANSDEAGILSACNCKARCSNNPPQWTKWYSRGRASSWGTCQDAAIKFCHSWSHPYGSTDASCD